MCSFQPVQSLELSFETRSAARARAFLRSAACRTHQTRPLHDAELLVTELVANGVRHGAPPITLSVECLGDSGSQVSVRDGAPTPPRLQPVEDMGEAGRGLLLVDYISESWGVEREVAGKTTWFRIAS